VTGSDFPQKFLFPLRCFSTLSNLHEYNTMYSTRSASLQYVCCGAVAHSMTSYILENFGSRGVFYPKI